MQDGQQQAHIVMRHITGVMWEGREMPTQDERSVAMMQWPGLTAARGHDRAYARAELHGRRMCGIREAP